MPASEAGGWLRMNPTDGNGVEDTNVTAFRFALLESDKLPLDLLLALFAKLPLPIAAIISSAGRSFHAWVRVDADTLNEYRDTVEKMISLLARFGVDTGNKNPSRLSRLPGVIRRIGSEGDGRQRLLYLNPKPVQRAIR
jgi:regulatory protein RepA